MDFMKKLNPFKRTHRQEDHARQTQNVRHHQQQLDHSDSKRKAADKELQHLNHKIEKILANLDENEAGMEFSREEECVVCLSSKATMKTYPCGHCVVCRLCFVKTIQSAVSERRLPLKCVVCRTKILKLKQQRGATRPSLRPWSRNPSNNPTTTATTIRGSQPSANLNQRSTTTSSSSSTTCSASLTIRPQNPPTGPRSSSSVVPSGAHKPTATKLMQPLLIYPATRPGDLKRRPGTGWMSPPTVLDPGTTAEAATAIATTASVPPPTTTFRLRAKAVLGSSSASASASVSSTSTGGSGMAGGSSGGGGGGGSGAV